MISSRLVKPSKQSRKEPLGDRSRMLIVGERLMRAGSEGNLLRSMPNQQQELQEQNLKMISKPEKVKRDRRPCSAEDVDNLDRKSSSRDVCDRSNPWSPRTLPRKNTLAMQTHNTERRREAFLELLKQKYPHHSSVIAGHQERLRDHKSRSFGTRPWRATRLSHAAARVPTPGLDAFISAVISSSWDKNTTYIFSDLSLCPSVSEEQECVRGVMSEGEALTSFTRGSRTRASLPVVKSSNYTKERSLGVLHLQYGEETKQILMPNEVSGADTVHALFVSAFPQQLTLSMLESPNMAIYIKDHVRNIYYELTDVRQVLNITPQSYLKVYHKDPNQAFNHNTRNNNGDGRIARERLYSSRQQQDGGQSMSHPLPSPQSHIQGFQGSLSPPLTRSIPTSQLKFTYNSRTLPAGAMLPRERASSTPSSSAILERRDVKPDEVVDPYGFPEARLSMSDAPDGSIFHQHSLYRQKSRKYSENQHSPLSPKSQKTPPPSPHRVNEVRMIDIHPGQNPHMMVERTGSLRRSFRKESNGTLEVAARPRGSMASPVYSDLHGERAFQGLGPSANPQSKRMKAMEKQLASLTGLVQHALFKGTNSSGGKDSASEKLISDSLAQDENSSGDSPVAVCKSPAFQSVSPSSPLVRDQSLGLLLSTFHRNVSTLRQQLHQIRQTELQNQVAMRTMLKQAEEELTLRLCEKLKMMDEPLKKQRKDVDEERHRYEEMEENMLLQLSELEQHVEQLKRNSGSAQRPVTMRDVEDGAVNLRKVGETLATLKGEFPGLQSRMHGVLRMEVEAVRFLKEEPQKMDNMLKRVKALTETLSCLRISATEGSIRTDPISMKPESPDSTELNQDSTTSQQHLSSNPAHFTITSSSNPAHCELISSSPIMVQRACSLALIPGHVRDAPNEVTVNPKVHGEVRDTPNREPAERDEGVDRRQAEAKADMELILQQAQANLMKNIPELELTNQEKSRASATASTWLEEVDTPHSPRPEATAPAEPVADKPVQTGSECVHKPPIEKPPKAGVDRVPSQDAESKSPPPAPPRRFSGTGLTTGRSGEVIYTSHKDPAPPQQEPEEVDVALQSKPQRVRPELKPKPRTLPPINAREQEEEESDEDKIIAELQVFEKCLVKDLEPRYVVDLTTHVHPDRELDPAFSLSSYDPKVIYYITGTAKNPSGNPLAGPEAQNEPQEEVVSSSKVAHLNSADFTQQPNVLTPSDLTLDSPQSIEESTKVSSDTQKIYASLPEFQKNSSIDEAMIPKESSESMSSKPENPVSVSSEKLSNNGSEVQVAKSLVRPETLMLSEEPINQEDKQQVLLRSSRGRPGYSEETSLSPDLPPDEGPPPSDNIAFMITKTRVQALSTGEYQQLVSSKEQDVETVKVGTDETMSTTENNEFSKKPVIIVFDEPMDIRQAYKRLSTIFECEEELDRTLSKERIIEDPEENNEEVMDRDQIDNQNESGGSTSGNHLQVPNRQQNLNDFSSMESQDAAHLDVPTDAKQEAKKKFKFKFPKKQLAAIGQALRTGTKTGKKTLQVVVYEDEEEPDGTVKEAREAKRFEIKSSIDSVSPDVSANEPSESQTANQQTSVGRTNEICQTAYKTLDSLEETIKQLETTITNMDPGLPPDTIRKDPKGKRVVENQKAQTESSPSKKPAPLGPKPEKPPQRKKPKVQCVPRPSSSLCTGSTKQNSSGSSSTNRVASPRSRQQAGSVEKPPKPPKLQDSQSQFRQVVLL
ncbi:sickle tail protein-like isoform X1 [Silurus asotus]|uniref:Sickle tail protein-like isoform X1 n=1 Tax=Silurus asotus TaxID=30991 RepID=A0AAD5FIJ1_SILAS|nr:sickle tail protein-like isoform X1 [Silurus asotus]